VNGRGNGTTTKKVGVTIC